jgi:hypothetical protein
MEQSCSSHCGQEAEREKEGSRQKTYLSKVCPSDPLLPIRPHLLAHSANSVN